MAQIEGQVTVICQRLTRAGCVLLFCSHCRQIEGDVKRLRRGASGSRGVGEAKSRP